MTETIPNPPAAQSDEALTYDFDSLLLLIDTHLEGCDLNNTIRANRLLHAARVNIRNRLASLSASPQARGDNSSSRDHAPSFSIALERIVEATKIPADKRADLDFMRSAVMLVRQYAKAALSSAMPTDGESSRDELPNLSPQPTGKHGELIEEAREFINKFGHEPQQYDCELITRLAAALAALTQEEKT